MARLPEDTVIVEGGYSKPAFLLGLPSLGMVSTKFCVALTRLQFPVNCVANSLVVERMEIGVARNLIVQQCLGMKPRPKYLFFLGDDMLPGWDALIHLWEAMEAGYWDFLSGLYYMKQEPPTPLAWRYGITGPLQPGIHFKVGETIPVDVCGLDFCLIKTEVFEEIEPPWFKTGIRFTPKSNGEGSFAKHTEDTYFLEKMKEAKKSIGVATGIRVAHYDVNTGMVY